MRFRQAMMATRRWRFFNRSKLRLIPAIPGQPTDLEIAAIERWVQDNQVAQYFLSQRLLDKAVMEVNQYDTAKEWWDVMTQEFTAKSMYAMHDLEHTFLDMRCPKGSNVCTFLMALRAKRNELIAAEVLITDRDYMRTVFRGIPKHLA